MEWLIVGFIILLVILSLLFWFTDLWKNDRIEKYLGLLGAFATITIIISFLITLQANVREEDRRRKEDQDKQAANFTAETQRYWVDVERQFSDEYPYLASLYKELYPQSSIIVPQLTSEQEAEAKNRQWHMCAQLIQLIENIVNTSQINPEQNYGWTVVFISWLKSKTLQSVWNDTRQYYNPITQTFIDGIINGQVKNPKQARLLLGTFHKSKNRH